MIFLVSICLDLFRDYNTIRDKSIAYEKFPELKRAIFSYRYAKLGFGSYSGSPKTKEEGRSPLIVEFGNPVDQNKHSCYYIFGSGDISRKAQGYSNFTFCSPE